MVSAMMHWTDHELGSAGWLLMGLTMVVFWGGLIAVTALVARQLMSRGRWGQLEPSGPADPFQLLDERLARGDIDPEEYLRRRELLSGIHRGIETRRR
jgi:putative membrane protein